LAYVNSPQRGGNVTPLGSNIAAARCGWGIENNEQWQRDVSLTLNMTNGGAISIAHHMGITYQ
ncbi:MAG: hypothetical protein K2N20_00610, partial [Helicobacter sp.]|nr:hypothetical protein [Helicobacter sp.]